MYNWGTITKVTIPERTFKFGVAIVKISNELPKNAIGFALCSQLIRAGTSVGANTEEAQSAQSKKDFIRGMTISLKEARECLFWLRIISESNLVLDQKLVELKQENLEIIRILTAIVKNSKK